MSNEAVEDYEEDRADQADEPVAAAEPVESAEPVEPAGSAETAEPDLPAEPVGPDLGAFQDRWSDIQNAFVEDPHRSVTEADALLTEVLTAYQNAVEQRREQISATTGDGADTEKMRLALLDYRSLITTMLPHTGAV
jgi:hypothetical protein